MWVVQTLLLITAWHGAELVFRYGLGVLSLPQAEEVGHHHSAVEIQNLPATPVLKPHQHNHHDHDLDKD
jgi:hypothetical protein